MDRLAPVKEWAQSISRYLFSHHSDSPNSRGSDEKALRDPQEVLYVYWRRKTALLLLSLFSSIVAAIFVINFLYNSAILHISLVILLLLLSAFTYNIIFYKELLCILDERGIVCAGSPDFVIPWKEIEFVVPVFRRPAFITYNEGGMEHRVRLWKERSCLLINTFNPGAILGDYYAALSAQSSLRKRRRIQALVMPVEYESDFELPAKFDYIEGLRWSWFASRDRLVITEQDATFVIFERPHRFAFCVLPIEEMLASIELRGVSVRSWDYEL
ncbi:MAG: hypothetical protein C4536_00975 [Actinobacteria bacterium]|nr:MAG: hypothetical protein C4536_00975 [Actinomycetota bacterium]